MLQMPRPWLSKQIKNWCLNLMKSCMYTLPWDLCKRWSTNLLQGMALISVSVSKCCHVTLTLYMENNNQRENGYIYQAPTCKCSFCLYNHVFAKLITAYWSLLLNQNICWPWTCIVKWKRYRSRNKHDMQNLNWKFMININLHLPACRCENTTSVSCMKIHSSQPQHNQMCKGNIIGYDLCCKEIQN